MQTDMPPRVEISTPPEQSAQTPYYAVFGQPIAHSQSPAIHRCFAAQLGMDLRYDAIEAGVEQFPDRLRNFAAQGGRGANITLPLKERAATLCAGLGKAAQASGAVNTLTRVADGWRGDNTDGEGLVRDLTQRRRLDLRGRRTLLLGAGGAAHGIAPALLDTGIAELVIVNRTPQRADALADRLGQPARAHSRYWNDLPTLGAFDLVVNATSAARIPDAWSLPAALIGTRCLCYDLNYGEIAVAFLAWARGAGASHVYDGLGMLIEQAAVAFELWHGQYPDTEPVHAAFGAKSAILRTAD